MHGETFISGTVVSTGHPGLRPKRFRTVMASRYIPYAAWRAPSKMPLHEGQQEPATWLQSSLVMVVQKKRSQRC